LVFKDPNAIQHSGSRGWRRKALADLGLVNEYWFFWWPTFHEAAAKKPYGFIGAQATQRTSIYENH